MMWWERNFSTKCGTDGPEKGHFAHPLHLQSPALSSSLLPPANVISFSFVVWGLTKRRPTATIFPLGETGKTELSLPGWYLYRAVGFFACFTSVCLFNFYFYITYSSANSSTFASPAHPKRFTIISFLLADCLCVTIRCVKVILCFLHFKSTLEGLLLLFRSLGLHLVAAAAVLLWHRQRFS